MNGLYKCMKACLIALILGLGSQCLAEQNLSISYDKSQVSDNFYVPAGGVYAAPNGIFILFDGRLIQVSTLCSDEKGIFVPGSEMSRQFVRCPICQHWYDPDRPHNCT